MRQLETQLLWPAGAPGAMGEGPEDKPRLTPVLPGDEAQTAPTPAVIVCPGGGYSRRADHEGLPVVQWLAGLGVAGVVLDYRVAPYRHPLPLADALRAIRLVRHNAKAWNIDPTRVGILGFSAGGHLAVSAATLWEQAQPPADEVDAQPSRPDALIACYPVVSGGHIGHAGSFKNLLGPEPAREMLDRLSLENAVRPDCPPAFIWHTADDATVPVENALVLAEAYARAKVPFELHVFPHGRHGLGLAGELPAVGAWTGLCATWLRTLWSLAPA